MPAEDPIDLYLRTLARAAATGVDTTPAALATADASGRPSVRVVLIRNVDARGFVFYTNYRSRKARELHANPRAALCQHWPAIEEQIRVEGRVEIVAPEESDAYFDGRPRDSQIGAWASEQSAVLASRDVLQRRFDEIAAQYEGNAVPRPPFWGGYRLVPDTMEFWYGRPGRLHERVLYERASEGWHARGLYP